MIVGDVLRPADLHIFEVVRQEEDVSQVPAMAPVRMEPVPLWRDDGALPRVVAPSAESTNRLFEESEPRLLPPRQNNRSSFSAHRIAHSADLLPPLPLVLPQSSSLSSTTEDEPPSPPYLRARPREDERSAPSGSITYSI